MTPEMQALLSLTGERLAAPGSRLSAAERHDSFRAAALAGTMQQLIDDLPEHIALLDEQCEILAVNHAWRRSIVEHGFVEALPRHNLRDFCAKRATDGYQPAAEACRALDDISSGRKSFSEFTYCGGESWGHRDFQVSINRIAVGNRNLILVTRSDVTELSELRRAKEELSHSLIEGQARERQRMARELHDSTSQLLTGISLLLGRLERNLPDPDAKGLLEEMQGLVSETQQSIRSISYLAVPPSLEKLGLSGAVKSLVDGYARRTGLDISVEVEGEASAVSPATASALYRVGQEALSNVHRHARANRARMVLCFRPSASHLVVADDGIGISPDTLIGKGNAGVGLASMRSRLSEIGGRLSIRGLSPGTAIVASVREHPDSEILERDRTDGAQPLSAV